MLASLVMFWSLLPALAAAEVPVAPALPQPIFTRQSSFGVPFVMDPSEPGARKPVEVQLHVSEMGGPWHLHAKAAPVNSSILFRASRDGEYRFMVRTKDDHGELQPVGPPHPELIVVLDTDPPVLELLAERGTGGEVHARWRVRDPHLRADSLRVEYQVGPDGPWMPVAVDLPPVGATVSAREATWVPEARSVPITVRAEVFDLAGNRATAQRIVAPAVAKRRAPGDKNPTADDDNTAASPWPGERTQDTPLGTADPPTMPGNFPKRSFDASSLAGSPARYGTITEEIGPGATAETLPSPHPETVLAQPTEQYLPVPTQPEEVGLPPTHIDARQSAPRTRRELEQIDGPRLPGPAMVPTSTEPLGAQSAALGGGGRAAAPLYENLPPGIRPRMINTRRIELDYELDAINPPAAPKIEIWGTKDGGTNWALFGTDEDGQGPAFVMVEDEGLYGFRIVVAGAGGEEDRPKAGDRPDMWIGTDYTKPVARLAPLEVGPNAQPGSFLIRWEASDALLAERPVSLYLSTDPSGPWSAIGLDLQNTGQYTWTPAPGTPERGYLRLEVRDMAGNVTVVDSPEPLSFVPTRPRVRIRDVRPSMTEPSASMPAWREFQR